MLSPSVSVRPSTLSERRPRATASPPSLTPAAVPRLVYSRPSLDSIARRAEAASVLTPLKNRAWPTFAESPSATGGRNLSR